MATFERLGPYRIQRTLGRGGMGSVFLGVDEECGREAAVKVLAPGLASEPNFRARFAAEVETLKKLTHPNIVQLLGFGEQDGNLFYAMEYVPGRTLQGELQSGRNFAWRDVARLGVEICQALKHAHDRGVIHRDLKPANLLLANDEHVKLTDFGIAKLYGTTRITAAGGVIGTVDYMAPEQAAGTGVTARSDLYSLGSVLFALLVGHPPFCGRTVPEVLHQLRYEMPVPVGRLSPETPHEFELIVGQLLEKEPSKRIATALAVANRLKAMDHALSPETRLDESDGQATDSRDTPQSASDSATYGGDDFTLSPHPGDSQSLNEHRKETVAMSDVVDGQLQDDAPDRPASSTHFTTYDAEASQPITRTADAIDEWPPLWLKIAPLLFFGLLISVAVWYFSRPPTADKIYSRIDAASQDDSEWDLVSIEDDVNEFLKRFPTDPRSASVMALQEEIELHRQQRRYERRARLRGGTGSLKASRAGLRAGDRRGRVAPGQSRCRFEGADRCVLGFRREQRRTKVPGFGSRTPGPPAAAGERDGRVRAEMARITPRRGKGDSVQRSRQGRCDPTRDPSVVQQRTLGTTAARRPQTRDRQRIRVSEYGLRLLSQTFAIRSYVPR